MACRSPVVGEQADALAPIPLGQLAAFWRYSAVLGPFLEGGQGLQEIPDYVLHGDFAYQKRPFAKEVPFADHLSVVRLLGGYANDKGTRDLVWRDAAGKIQYRLELLRPRLQPYLDCGYTNLTLVLDNVPWCFPATPHSGTPLGQSAPPRDPAEWHEFIKAVCRELVNIIGPAAARQLRFRVGTENNARERFDGTQDDYWRHYGAAATAVREVLPGGKFGAFNIAGVSRRSLPRQNVNAFALAESCAQQQLPFDWVAYSRYYRPGDDPDQHAQVCRQVWDEFARRVPALQGVSREIHEFGIAPWGEVEKGAFASAEPGALGAALSAQMIWRLRAAGINRLWHWGVADAFRDRENQLQQLWTSEAWLRCVLDQMAGGDAYLFSPLETSASHTTYLAAGSFKNGRGLLMISAYNTNIATHASETISFRVPAALQNGSGVTVRFVRLTPQAAIHDRIRRAFAAAGCLNAEFNSRPDRLGTIRQMGAGRKAEILVGEHLTEYQRQWVDSLTLKPLTPDIGTVTRDGGGTTIRAHLTAPEVLVLELPAATR